MWYLPLAVNCSRVGKITGSLTADERNKWHSEVSLLEECITGILMMK